MRFVATFLLCVFLLNAAEPSFEHTYELWLEKDERASVEIVELGREDEKQNFDFYWTLFDTNKIVIHTKFRRFPRQFVLSMRRNLNWLTQTLIPDWTNPHLDRARLIIEFSDFDRGEAKFKIYIEDKDSRLNVAFLDPNKTPLRPPFAPQKNKIVPGIIFGVERNDSLGKAPSLERQLGLPERQNEGNEGK